MGKDQRHDSGQADSTAQEENEHGSKSQVGGNRPGTLEEGKGGGQEGALMYPALHEGAALNSCQKLER